jgi:hypothetical protein
VFVHDLGRRVDGWRFGAELEADPSFAPIPLVLMSGAPDLEAQTSIHNS